MKNVLFPSLGRSIMCDVKCQEFRLPVVPFKFCVGVNVEETQELRYERYRITLNDGGQYIAERISSEK